MPRLPVLIAICCLAGSAAGQQLRVQVARQEPPYYAGEPAILQFTVQGLDERPEPTCRADTPTGRLPEGLRGRMTAANPRVFSQIVQRNGQIYRSEQVTYEIRYQVTAQRPGDFRVGPFLIKQGNKQTRVEAVEMSFGEIPPDLDMQIRLKLPEGPLYPDQRVPVEIEWAFAGDVEDIINLNIYSPLFDQFRFAPDEQPDQRTARMIIDTNAGRLALPAKATRENRDGRQFVVVTARRIMIPDRVGRFPLDPIAARLRKAGGWKRSASPFDDINGLGAGGSLLREFMQERRTPSKTALSLASGQPQLLIIEPFPDEDRPDSFAGAVGDGFAIDVAADRTVVRVGDPIRLNVTVRGDGNIDNARLPKLSADGGMSPDQFRLPEGDVPGTLGAGEKQFRVSVRVADESVTEIPALAYSWFDPQQQAYQTARSKPIALRVLPAQIVSADDVVRATDDNAANGASPNGNSPQPSAGSQTAQQVALANAPPPEFALGGADLALESRADRVLRNARQQQRNLVFLQAAIYACGAALVAIAWIDRRRRTADPRVAEQRKVLQQQRARIRRAAGRPPREAADDIAAALRILMAQWPPIDRQAAQRVISDCEAIAYSPELGVGDGRLDESLWLRAKRVAEAGSG